MRAASRWAGAGTPYVWPPSLGFDRQPFAAISAGLNQLQAGPNGLAIGIFCWADPVAGLVSNVQSANTLLGFALPTFNGWNWQRTYLQPANNGVAVNNSGLLPPPNTTQAPFALMILRAGMPCVVAASGDFHIKFPLGATAGARVWADPATGLPYCFEADSYALTAWTCMQNSPPNSAVRISTFVSAFN